MIFKWVLFDDFHSVLLLSQANLICGTWNICRGLVTRENELTQLLDKENIDILFLIETDTSKIESENDYVLNGYKTILPLRNDKSEKIRIMLLIKESIASDFKISVDLMSPNFPSIWLEKIRIDDNNSENSLAIGLCKHCQFKY